jgi:probable phosphoglycerate mutase
VRRLFPGEDAAWRRGEDIRRGGGETYAEVGARAGELFDEVLAAGLPRGNDSLVVFVLHAGTARSLIGRQLGLPVPSWSVFGPLRNCHWSVLRLEHGRYRLVEHNVGAAGTDRVGTGPRKAAVGTLLPSQALAMRGNAVDEDAATAPDTDPVHSPPLA